MSVISLHAQKAPKSFAEISIGPSFPIGQFGEKTYNVTEKEQPGLACIGIAANATFGKYLKENVGLLLTAGYSTNKQKAEGLEEYLAGTYPAGASVDVTTKSWRILKVMAGGFLVTPLAEDKLNLVTKISAGICSAIIPEYSWTARNTGYSSYEKGGVGKVRLPATFCYQISLGLQYKMNEKAYLLFDINSFNATATNKGGQTSGGRLPDRKVKLGTVNALVGVGLNF